MAGIPTSNILQPGAITVAGGANRALVSQLQLLTPQWYKTFVEKYGAENWTWWLATYGGMEQVMNRDYQWFENRGKLQIAIGASANVSAAVAGGTISVTLAVADHYNSGTQTPLRAKETVRVASTNVEGEILAITGTTANAFTFTVRPKRADQTLASAGSTSFLTTDYFILGGQMDAGEASSGIDPQAYLTQKYTNTVTEMRETWAATDLAEMTEVFFENGVSGSLPAGSNQAGTSYYTYLGLVKSNQRFVNNVEFKLMRGDVVTNTGLTTSTSVGSQGFLPKIATDGETVGYTPGNLDFAQLHTITRVMDVNSCAKLNMWMMDIYQKQDFSDGIFNALPAGAFVWGKGLESEEASVSYGFKTVDIDGYRFQTAKYTNFNTEALTGKTPLVDYYRNYGFIAPMSGETADAHNATKKYKNITVMAMNPPAGGSIGNGIRVWEHGGGSRNPTDATMNDNIQTICYRGTRVVAANQFLNIVSA